MPALCEAFGCSRDYFTSMTSIEWPDTAAVLDVPEGEPQGDERETTHTEGRGIRADAESQGPVEEATRKRWAVWRAAR